MPAHPAAERHFDPFSRALHWLTAIAVLIAFILGPGGFGRMVRQGIDPATRPDIVWHESLGVLVFVVVVAAGMAIGKKFAEREKVARRWAAAARWAAPPG